MVKFVVGETYETFNFFDPRLWKLRVTARTDDSITVSVSTVSRENPNDEDECDMGERTLHIDEVETALTGYETCYLRIGIGLRCGLVAEQAEA